jgi:hypothetical protein
MLFIICGSLGENQPFRETGAKTGTQTDLLPGTAFRGVTEFGQQRFNSFSIRVPHWPGVKLALTGYARLMDLLR